MNIVRYKGLDVNPANLHESITVKTSQTPNIRLNESTGAEEYLMPRIEAIHAGATRNYNHYLAERLKGDPLKKTGVYSWMNPYAKPVIYNHDTETEVTGRILHAAYADYTQAGRPGIILIPKISEPRAVESLKAGRLLTVSVGATTDAAVCSICGTDIINEGYCGHMKGEQYDGRVCEWIAGDIWFEELSWVNVPADQDAMVVDTQTSIFLNTPENTEATQSQSTSANRPLTELFGVPKGTTLIVPKTLTEAEKTLAEKQGQEENRGMENTNPEAEVVETDTTAEETPVTVEVETETVVEPVVTEEPKETEEPVAAEPEAEKPAEEPEAPKKDEAEEELAESFASIDHAQIVLENAGLKHQVESLTSELKKILISQIAEKTQVKPELKESFEQRLNERSIESLRDKLTDLAEEMSFVEKEVAVKEEAPRTVKKVVSPVPVNTERVSKETVLTEQEKLNTYKKLLGL